MANSYCTPTKNMKEVLNIPPSPFLKRLGYGTGVTVYKFDRSPRANVVRSPWAVKVINRKGKNTLYGKRLRDEADLLSKMSHPNIVGFRAIAKTSLGNECLAMETCTISLADLIEKRADDIQIAFSAATIMKVGHHISKALDYLHVRMQLLHGDVKSHNVLIIGDFEMCKLCDFGVSLPLTKDGALDTDKAGDEAEYVGTMCWCAPEVLRDPPCITSKADIFAYGLVLWEMFALNIPHAVDINDECLDEECSFDSSFKENSNLFGTRPAIPYHMFGDQTGKYNYPLEIFYCCTEEDPKKRPTGQHIAMSLYEMISNSK
ncbi:uncharacterized protein CBL_00372 [Carabus blaptoides fortunei]